MNKKIDLSGKWVSAFVQNNKLYNEQVVLEQKENFVSANMILNYNNMIWHYKFEGKIHKNIITGTYDCLDECDIESGTISLKIINDDFLYGVATYLSDDKTPSDVVQSPYALFRNTENNLGTFNLCSGCVGKEGTCCADQHVDMPMLLPNEVEIISKNMKISKNDFCQIVSFSSIHNDYALKDLYQMKRQEKKEGCYFYRDNQCTIYDIRPIDCRIFPYDIKLEKDGNYYLVYYKTYNCQIKNETLKDIKMISYNARLFLRMLLPYLREWADDYCCSKLTENTDYEIICKIEDLF